MRQEWDILWSRLHEPDYLIHVLLPLITYGLWFGMVLLILGYVMKNRQMRSVALLLIGACGLLVFPYERHHKKALPVLKADLSAVGREKMDALQVDVNAATYRFYSLAAAAFAGVWLAKKAKLAFLLHLGVLIGAFFMATKAMNYGLKEWEIYRPELVRPTGR